MSMSEASTCGRAGIVVALGPHMGAAAAADTPHRAADLVPVLLNGTSASGRTAWACHRGAVGQPRVTVACPQKCAACRGDEGEGGTNDRLVGDQITGGGPVVKSWSAIGPMPALCSTSRGAPCRGPRRNRQSWHRNHLTCAASGVAALAGIRRARPPERPQAGQ
jgi:hypothetical protein